MQIVYYNQSPPETFSKSIFLGGPTVRRPKEGWRPVKGWRPEAIALLEQAGYDGVVFVPEPAEGDSYPDYGTIVEWEERGLKMADCILFWIPRQIPEMCGLTTNDEWGAWKSSGKLVMGAPQEAEHVRYQRYYAAKLGIPVSDKLEDVVKEALKMVGEGADRSGGQRYIPLRLWRNYSFQSWLKAQEGAGNSLVSAKVEWTFPNGNKKPFLWAVHAAIDIGYEGRQKTNEVVVGRNDIGAVVLYRKSEPYANDTKVVLVKEFRTPSSNRDGYIYELPGGSAKTQMDPLEMAAEEVEEEVGLKLDHSRLKSHGHRQLAGTLSAHRAHLFSAMLTENEVLWLESQKNIVKGKIEDTERTYVEVVTLRSILSDNLVDWSNIGMILSVIV